MVAPECAEQPPHVRDGPGAIGHGGLQFGERRLDRADVPEFDVMPQPVEKRRGGCRKRSRCVAEVGRAVVGHDPGEAELMADRVEQRIKIDRLR